MSPKSKELLEQLDQQLSCPIQSWLFGAGISFSANIPLMVPLTARVAAMLHEKHKGLYEGLASELPDQCHIEHILSHLGDYIALAGRSRNRSTMVAGSMYDRAALEESHTAILSHISTTVRWGYISKRGEAEETVGEQSRSLVQVDGHLRFLRALFQVRQAGLHDRRRPIHIFTTNYDTLLEDGLSLAGIPYYDGFVGGAVAFWNHRFGQSEPESGFRAYITKLHGSIDWHLSDEGKVTRVRDGDLYPARNGRVLIYPQATKYIATQHDPFATQFDRFRRALAISQDNVLGICGYSFGDEHINGEIEQQLSLRENKTTLLAFIEEREGKLPDAVERWRRSMWGKRLYVATNAGLYVGTEGPVTRSDEVQHDWWTFEGLSNLLTNGVFV